MARQGGDVIGRWSGRQGDPRRGRDNAESGLSLKGAAGVQIGSENVQLNYFYGSARQAASPGTDRAPIGFIRVIEADVRRMGVHAAISVPGIPDEVLPEYIERDADAAEFGVRAKIAAAALRGGFVVLVGGSSVGKSRCAAEAVKALLPEWQLLHPAGLAEISALAQAPQPSVVLWLDELQRYLDGEHGLTCGAMRTLLNARHPIVIVGTLWPDLYTAYTAQPIPGSPDPYARAREVLELATFVRIGPEFSPAEQGRARAAAARDPRLRVALRATGYGLTQTLAAAPQLVARWQDAQVFAPYARALLTAALDTARLGARAPLSSDFLRAATPNYCTSQQQAEAPDAWFEEALGYATEKLHGAAAALSPAGAGMGWVVGYVVADYLLQYVSRERHASRVPAGTWDAIVSHISDPADNARLAASAESRLLNSYAVLLYQHATDGDWSASERLATLLAKREELGRLRIQPGTDHGSFRNTQAWLLAGKGDLDGLRALADAGEQSDEGQLLRSSDDAAFWLAGLLDRRGDTEGALAVLRARAEAGNTLAVFQLCNLLESQGDLDGLRTLANAGEHLAASRLARVLEERGDLRNAMQVLQASLEAGDHYAAEQLCNLLEKQEDLDGLRALADDGSKVAVDRLAKVLEKHGHLTDAIQQRRAQAEDGAWFAAGLLAELLVKSGDIDGAVQVLRTEARAGHPIASESAAERLAELLVKRGDIDAAIEVLRAQPETRSRFAAERTAGRLVELLVMRGDIDGAVQVLGAQADAGNVSAARRLTELLAERGDLETLRARADAGDRSAAQQLGRVLAERGELETLRVRADAGDGFAAKGVADLLAERGDLAGAARVLRDRADAGDRSASFWLAACSRRIGTWRDCAPRLTSAMYPLPGV